MTKKPTEGKNYKDAAAHPDPVVKALLAVVEAIEWLGEQRRGVVTEVRAG